MPRTCGGMLLGMLVLVAGEQALWAQAAQQAELPKLGYATTYYAANADLTVVGVVQEITKPADMKLLLPDQGLAPVANSMVTCKVAVSQVVWAASSTTRPATGATTRQVSTQVAAAPKDILVLAEAVTRVSLDSRNTVPPALKVGQSYVLMLRAIPGRAEFYLPPSPLACPILSDEVIDRVKKARAEPEGWAWGKAVDGLQLTMAPLSIKNVQNVPDAQAVQAELRVAVRNVSDKPILLNLYLMDKLLDVAGKGPGGETFRYRAPVDRLAQPVFDQNFMYELMPGRVITLGPYGVTYGEPFWMNLPSMRGNWTIQAIYHPQADLSADELARIGKKGVDLTGRILWKGELASPEVKVDTTPRSPALQ